ncbi:MAG TPA: dienelactone hydrolase family protein [Acidimicrobiales bacterium]|nr:dienelactone hydrolase family protein [Acidimicrobiales bacterium]
MEGPGRAARPAGRRPAVRGVALLLLSATVLGACSSSPATTPEAAATPGTHVAKGDTVPTVADLTSTSFVGGGPFAVGETTLTLPTDGAPVEVWYPATTASVAHQPEASYDLIDWLPAALRERVPHGFTLDYPSGGVRGVPVAPGRYPLVVFSHGYAGYRDQSTFLTAHLAEWGFVVAAPDHLGRDLTEVLGGPKGTTSDVADLTATVALLTHENSTSSSPFHGHVDTSLVGAVGHSAGGSAVEALAASDPGVTTFIGLAGATVGSFGQTATGPGSVAPTQPGMLMSGTADQVVLTSSMVTAYARMHTPKRIVLLSGAGHLVFADACEVGTTYGGLLALAQAFKVPVPASLLPLASDGCKPPDTPPPDAWPAVRQAVTAQLRHALGFDSSSVGLAGLQRAFPTVVAANRAEPGP